MKRIFIIVYSTFLIILIVNFVYYKGLYNKQIEYILELLDRQVRIVGSNVDKTNNGFLSDLNEIGFLSDDLALFFTDPQTQARSVERMKLFFSRYQDFITGIKFYDRNKNEYSLRKDINAGEWLEFTSTLQQQAEIIDTETLAQDGGIYSYSLPVIDVENSLTIGNIVVSVDYKKFFTETFSVFYLKDYQWQWVLDDTGEIVYDNVDGNDNSVKTEYSEIERITSALADGLSDNIIHKASFGDKKKEIITSFYSTQLLRRDFGILFSAPTEFFQKYIIINSLFIVLGTIILIQLIIFVFIRYVRAQKRELESLKASEKMLFKLIEEMPVGVIIHNKMREIIKANNVAAGLYSYKDEAEMKGKIFPEPARPGDNNYFLVSGNGSFRPDQFVIIPKETGEKVLFRNSIPVVFMGENADMEILMDVTLLESARKQEAKANVAKSEFLKRMSYEIRTPLNGIIGITDVLTKYQLTAEVKEIVSLLHKSTEVLLNMINDILDFSRIESGKMILDEIPFNLREEINYCTDLAKTYLVNDVKLILSVDENVPQSIIGDPFRLRQVLTNLLFHSAKNTSEGEIRLKCSINGSEDGILTLGFELADTGISLERLSLKKIFGDFVNIEAKAVRANDEEGFGTILAKQLVELMGGVLEADSPSGLSGDTGIKVSFSIKTFSNDRPMKELPIENITSPEMIKTLVITGNQNRDDETLAALHKLGLGVTVTTFMKTTVSQIKANLTYSDERYKLVILTDDEEFNGFEAARVLWENNLSTSFVMLMISSNDKKGNYNKCITLGIDNYLIKPFEFTELINIVRKSFPYLKEEDSFTDIGLVRKDLRILIVEDNKMNQKVMGTMLETLGYKCDVSEDGYQGYLQAKLVRYDIIFMDLIMPEMDGYESAQKILQYDKANLIVAFTADSMPESRKKAEMAGIRDFISKPVRIEDLKKLFVKYFRG